MSKKEVIDRIIKENRGKHLEVLKRVQKDDENYTPGDIETLRADEAHRRSKIERKTKNGKNNSKDKRP